MKQYDKIEKEYRKEYKRNPIINGRPNSSFLRYIAGKYERILDYKSVKIFRSDGKFDILKGPIIISTEASLENVIRFFEKLVYERIEKRLEAIF